MTAHIKLPVEKHQSTNLEVFNDDSLMIAALLLFVDISGYASATPLVNPKTKML
ncbi:hypothetical protein ACFL0C_02395 [Patescibacteria group bacterium]